LTACQNGGQVARIDAAAKKIGEERAAYNPPDYPDYCRQPMGTVIPKLSEPVWGPQERWEILQENENKRIEWCANHVDQWAAAARGGK
jgi:hypothetical protein